MPEHTLTWLDGTRCDALPLPDRGLAYGDGLFETLLVRRAHILYVERHLARLSRGLDVLGFPDCLATVDERLRQAVASLPDDRDGWHVVRVTVTRGAGPRGYAPPATATPRVIVQATRSEHGADRLPPPATVGEAAIRLPRQPALAGLKHLNRLEQVLAAAEAVTAGLDDMLMLGQGGELGCLTAGNLFLVRAGMLLTPPAEDCAVLGTRRSLLIDRWAPAAGVAVREQRLFPADLETAEAVFSTNSVLGLRPVGRFGDRRWHDHSVCKALFERYLEDLP